MEITFSMLNLNFYFKVISVSSFVDHVKVNRWHASAVEVSFVTFQTFLNAYKVEQKI